MPVSQRVSESVVLAGSPRDVAVARAFTMDTLGSPAYDSCRDDVVLVVSELATNAIVHAGGTVLLRIDADARCVRIEVTDSSHDRPQLAHSQPLDSTHGRGLPIMSMVTTQWGVQDRDGVGKTVWCELAVS